MPAAGAVVKYLGAAAARPSLRPFKTMIASIVGSLSFLNFLALIFASLGIRLYTLHSFCRARVPL